MAGGDLSERLQRARRAAGLTQDELGMRLRTSGDPRFKSTNGTRVGDWERRTPRVPFFVVDGIAHALGVPVSTFSDYPPTQPAARGGRGLDAELAQRATELEQRAADLAERLRRALGS